MRCGMRDAGCGMRDATKWYGLQDLGGDRLRQSRRLYDMRTGCAEGGFSLSLPEESELVILSAAGAKDLLSHRCEGPISGAAGADDLLFAMVAAGRLSGAGR